MSSIDSRTRGDVFKSMLLLSTVSFIIFIYLKTHVEIPCRRLAELKKTHTMCHMKMEKKRFGQEKRVWNKNSMDPIGQSYLPGYFCPAALCDSRETTQDKGRVGQRQHREIIVPRIKQR